LANPSSKNLRKLALFLCGYFHGGLSGY
jgi:hypothetical protein